VYLKQARCFRWHLIPTLGVSPPNFIATKQLSEYAVLQLYSPTYASRFHSLIHIHEHVYHGRIGSVIDLLNGGFDINAIS